VRRAKRRQGKITRDSDGVPAKATGPPDWLINPLSQSTDALRGDFVASGARSGSLRKEERRPGGRHSVYFTGRRTSLRLIATSNGGFHEHDGCHFMNTPPWRWRESNPPTGERLFAGRIAKIAIYLGKRVTNGDRSLPRLTRFLCPPRVLCVLGVSCGPRSRLITTAGAMAPRWRRSPPMPWPGGDHPAARSGAPGPPQTSVRTPGG